MTPEAQFRDGMHATVLNFEGDIRRIHTDRALAYESGEQLIGLARALCESEGRNPDNIVLGAMGSQPYLDGKNTTAFICPIAPLWWHYLSEAGAALRFMKAAQSTDKPTTEAVVDFMGEVRKAAGR